MQFKIRASLAAGLLVLATTGPVHAQATCLDVLDFEGLRAGAIVTSVTGATGSGPVAISGSNPLLGPGVDAAIIYDSSCSGGCTGGDADLGTPNSDFRGPGSGLGGAAGAPGENSTALGNVLIIAEDLVDADNNGLVDDPDDQGDQPVAFTIDFAAVGNVIVHELTVVDIDDNRAAGTISMVAATGVTLSTVAAPITGNNGTAIVDLSSTAGVRRLDIDLGQSAAIDNIVFSVPCDDGNPCTVDRCEAGACVNEPIAGCVRCSTSGDCNDGNPCTDDVCDSGVCSNPVNSSACDDGVFCNGADLCRAGSCSVHAGNPCPAGSLCNEINQTCDLMECTVADDPACDDGNVCTTDSCDVSTGSCMNKVNTDPCDDGIFCNGVDTCDSGSCSIHAGNPCPAGSLCNEINRTCDLMNCTVADDPACDDGNVCTTDFCEVSSGTCIHSPNTAACDDGIFCNGVDTCGGGLCSAHSGDPCLGGGECADTCDESRRTCFDLAGAACTSDGNVCSDNICDGVGTCVPVNNAAPCDDGIFCNGADTCLNGECSLHDGDPCPGGTLCNESGQTCDAMECTSVDDPTCDDANPCTTDSCDLSSGTCRNSPNTDPCDDGVFCNGADTCSSGACSVHAGDPCPDGTLCNESGQTCDAMECTSVDDPACDDANPCTTDSCDLSSGTCLNSPNTDPCDDGVFCNGIDACENGSCTAHAGDPCASGGECANSCNESADDCFDLAGADCTSDGNDCTDDVCDGAGACAHPNNTDPCDDGIFCNGADTCADGTCSVSAGDPCVGGPECADTCNESAANCFDSAGTDCTSDGNDCTDDICDGSGTCTHPGNTAPCDDGLFCNGADSCVNGACEGHTGDPCMAGEACDEISDMCIADGCTSGPRMIVEDVTCVVGSSACEVTIVLDTGSESIGGAAATITSPGAFTCGSSCAVGSAASMAACVLNPTKCRFTVIDTVFPIDAFGEGPIALTPITCDQEGVFDLTLTEFSLGNIVGGTIDDACVVDGTLTCNAAQANACSGPGDGAACDDGLFCNGIEICESGGCMPGTPPCAGACDEQADECVATCVGLSLGTGVSCVAGEDCSLPVTIDTGGMAVGSVGIGIDAGQSLQCSSCTAEDAAAGASCFVNPPSCNLQMSALAAPFAPFEDGLFAQVGASCAAPMSGELCIAAVDAFGTDGINELPVCGAACVPYACTPANQLCSSQNECGDGVDCTADCCSFDPDTSTLECVHEDNACFGCAEGPRLAGVDTLCTVGTSCDVAIQVESGIDPIASISGTLAAPAGLTIESLSLGACTASSQAASLTNVPQFSMAAPTGTAFCDGDALIATVRCDEVGVRTLMPTSLTLGDDRLPLPLPICGGCGHEASIVCLEPGLLIACGDATLEGRLTSTDSLVVLRHSVGMSDPCPRSVCDVDSNGRVTANDAVELLYGVVGGTTLSCSGHQTATPGLGALGPSTTLAH